MRTFVLRRDFDVSGVSGTGDVAEGVMFDDGTAVLHWRAADGATGVYRSIYDVLQIHGHGGSTVVVFTDEEPLEAAA